MHHTILGVNGRRTQPSPIFANHDVGALVLAFSAPWNFVTPDNIGGTWVPLIFEIYKRVVTTWKSLKACANS